MRMKFYDCIGGNNCVITVDAGKVSKILGVEGIASIPKSIEAIYLNNCTQFYPLYREYSADERESFFRGYPISGDARINLSTAYEKWNAYIKNGSPDPFWCDGVGLNAIRKRIIFLKQLIERLCTPDEYPDCYYYDIPAEITPSYMANKDQLVETGYKYAEQLEKEPFFSDIVAVAERTASIYEKMCKGDKWGVLRNIHWMAKLPEVYRNYCDTNNLVKLKEFRKSYDTIITNLKEQLKSAIEEEKNQKDDDVLTEGIWEQLSIFEFI